MNKRLVIPSFAKINLTLKVLGRRPDDFHEIFTVFQTISLHDELVFTESDEICVSSDNANIPVNKGNIVFTALEALRNYSGCKMGLSVSIKKRVPSPGGLGGGSSNAAVALLAAARIWGLDVNRDELVEIGAEIGSDIPFFMYGGTAIGTGRGSEIEPNDDVSYPHVLIASSGAEIATPKAYRDLGLGDLTKKGSKRILKHYREEAQALYTGRFEFENDFESVVFSKHPEIENISRLLASNGAQIAMLSGSGPSVFGLFESLESMMNAKAALGSVSGVRCFLCSTVSRASYFERLGLGSGLSFDF